MKNGRSLIVRSEATRAKKLTRTTSLVRARRRREVQLGERDVGRLGIAPGRERPRAVLREHGARVRRAAAGRGGRRRDVPARDREAIGSDWEDESGPARSPERGAVWRQGRRQRQLFQID